MELAVAKDLSSILKEHFGLTPTERQICEFLSRGNTRSDLRRLLGINENCLKWHLKQIYAKTIGDAPNERDKLHRLTVFLWRLEREQQENYT